MLSVEIQQFFLERKRTHWLIRFGRNRKIRVDCLFGNFSGHHLETREITYIRMICLFILFVSTSKFIVHNHINIFLNIIIIILYLLCFDSELLRIWKFNLSSFLFDACCSCLCMILLLNVIFLSFIHLV